MSKTSVTLKNTKVNDSTELLSYIINQTPVLRENIDLPVQGQSIKPIGKLIMDNPVYKNAFLNTVNIIGATVITRNNWESPWKRFTDKGVISYGSQVREIIVDIADVYDYNEMVDKPCKFCKTEVPNVLNYLHEVNFQKFYKTTTSDIEMSMAFDNEDLFTLVDQVVNSLYEGLENDYYQVSKYVLARRILEGTVTPVYIENLATKTDRDVVAEIKKVSNDMTFRTNKFNPAGITKAVKFEDQFAIVSTLFDAKFTTNVLATSYFRSDAEMKANMALCDGFGNVQDKRLNKLFAKRDDDGNIVTGEYVAGYTPLTSAEKTLLDTIPCVIVGRDFFQMYRLSLAARPEGTRATMWENPQTLRTNHWLFIKAIMSSSPFESAAVFTPTAPDVTSVTVSPATATITKGQTLQLTAVVETAGFANKAVVWSVDDTAKADGVTINQRGILSVPANATVTSITVTATSIYKDSVTGTATITVA